MGDSRFGDSADAAEPRLVRLSAARDLRGDAPFAEPSAVDVVVVPAVGIQRSGLEVGPPPFAPYRWQSVDQWKPGDVVAVGTGQRYPQ